MEKEKYALAPYVAVAAPVVLAVVVAFAAYVDRKVAPVAEYVASVYRLPEPAKPEVERLAARREDARLR